MTQKAKKLGSDFFEQDVLTVAPQLIGKILVRRTETGEILRRRITETEAYRGEEDSACHARAGKTNRTEVLYEKGGCAYVYLCYGIHYLLNTVTGKQEQPQAALIRGAEGYDGPAKLTKAMNIGKDLNRVDLTKSDKLWIEDDGRKPVYTTDKRIGINYASEPYKSMKWRFIAVDEKTGYEK